MNTSVFREGVLVGLAGAVVVAVWFLVYDIASGAAFRTPALLGSVLFEHLRDPDALVITTRPVLEYTLVHGIVFIAFGIAAAGLFSIADRARAMLLGIFMLFCCFEVAFLAATSVVSEVLSRAFHPGAVLGANALASVVMLSMLFRNHRRSPSELLTADG